MLFLIAMALAPLTASPADSTGLGVSLERDVRYGEANGVALLLDIYLPSGPELHPALLVIHGGSWNSGDKAEMSVASESFAEAGFVSFAVDYRLAPASTYPAQVDDLQTAVRWIRAHASRYHVDPNRVGAFGVSAGGHLASLLATLGEGPTNVGARVAAAMSWSGPEDFTTILGGLPGFGPLDAFVGCSFAACPEKWREASPVSHVDPTDAPLLLANSSEELVPFSQATEMARALKRRRVPTTLIEVPGNRHVIYGYVKVGPYGKNVTQLTLEFARRWLGQTESGSIISPTPTPTPSQSLLQSSGPGPASPPNTSGAGHGSVPLVPIAATVAGVLALGAAAMVIRSRR
jgi:acetyl esterase